MTDTPSYLDINVDAAQEIHTLPNDSEAMLRVEEAAIVPKKDDAGRNVLYIMLVDPNDPTVQEVKIWRTVPDEQMENEDPRAYNKALLWWKDFYRAVGHQGGPLDPDALVGVDVWVILGEEDNTRFGLSNFVRRFVVKR